MSKYRRLTMIMLMLMLMAILLVSLQTRSQKPSTNRATRHLTIMGFRLGKSTIAGVQARLGASTVGRCPDLEGAYYEICYVSPGSDKTTAVFEASVSGGGTRVDGFRVIAGSRNTNCRLQCTNSRVIRSTIETAGGLKLGLNRAEVLNLLGTPQQTTDDKLSFQWQSKVRVSQESAKNGQKPDNYSYWNVVDTINVTLADSKVVDFEVIHSVTN
jgi:hypothetical protein